MPRRIVTADAKTFRFAEYDLPPLGPRDVRVEVSFAAPKHGTEGHLLSGSSLSTKKWDKELRMFLPLAEGEAPTHPPAERGIGNMVVGVVSETGPEVTLCKEGDEVFGYGPVRETAQAEENKWFPLCGLSPEDAVCVDPAHVAFVAVRDGHIRIGDTVAVFGLGAIGLLAVQIAQAAGAAQIFAVDPLPNRRAVAASFGAIALDPTQTDAALQIKFGTQKAGVDVSLETSGSGRALHESIRCLRPCGTMVHVAWGPRDASALRLDEEFHVNRPQIIGSQAWEGWGNPDRDYPRWNPARAFGATIELFRRNGITGQPVVTPTVPFPQAPEALAQAFTHPETTIKLGISF